MNVTRSDTAPAVDEAGLRERLGIPASAERVLVIAESTHWDPDWLLRSDQYFRWMVKPNLDKAIAELAAEPRRVYGLECTFFPQMYWNAVDAAQRDRIRDLVNTGRLRFTGSGVTTPDTFIPREETLLRDYLLGQEWLRTNGMDPEPRLAYFPDSFGHSPELPALLRAAGFEMAAVTRIDGMYFPGTDWEPPSRYPRPASTAERLLEEERTLDFVWRSTAGAEVLAHWNAFGYGHGDMIAAHGVVRWLTLPTYVPDRREAFVRRRIERYVRDLSAVALTPYMLLTMGIDFVPPVPRLWDLIDRWNTGGYERTGVWLTNAAYEDYMDLVGFHRDRLPVLELDPNPYWTGFYSSRPDLKRACTELADTLVLAEGAAVADGDTEVAVRLREETAAAWQVAVTANHHDWITGTSPDRVARGEQHPWLERAQHTAEGALVSAVSGTAQPPSRPSPVREVRWSQDGNRVEVDTTALAAVVDADRGGCLVELHDKAAGTTVCASPAADLVVFEDSGGLWRMGMEFAGGRFRELDAASRHRADVTVEETDRGVEVVATCVVAGRATERRYIFGPDGRLRVRTVLGCDDRRTAVLRFPLTSTPRLVRMHQPGGVVDRPLRRHFDPTYWPLHSFAAALDSAGAGVAVACDVPTAVDVSPDGVVDVVVARNAVREQAWGWLPLLATLAKGRVRGDVTFDVAVWAVDGAESSAGRLCTVWRDLATHADADPVRSRARRLVAAAFETDDPAVAVVTAKLAHRGDGVVVRLRDLRGGAGPVRLRLPGRHLAAAHLCDARERDLAELAVGGDGDSDGVDIPLTYGFATVRLTLEPAGRA